MGVFWKVLVGILWVGGFFLLGWREARKRHHQKRFWVMVTFLAMTGAFFPVALGAAGFDLAERLRRLRAEAKQPGGVKWTFWPR